MGIIDMSKKSKKKQGKKFYFYLINNPLTIQSIYAETIEEAEQYLNEQYGEGTYTLGSLNKALSKEEKKRINEISEQIVGELLGENARRVIHDINSF